MYIIGINSTILVTTSYSLGRVLPKEFSMKLAINSPASVFLLINGGFLYGDLNLIPIRYKSYHNIILH